MPREAEGAMPDDINEQQQQQQSDAMSGDTVQQETEQQTDERGDDQELEGLGDRGKEALRREREAARKAEAARRQAEKELKQLRQRLAELENANKSEAERVVAERDSLKTEVEQLRAQVRAWRGREAVRAAARRMGADDKRLDLIVRAVKADLQFDDDGEPVNVDDLLNELKDTDPSLFKPIVPRVDGGSGTTTKPKQGKNDWLRQAFAARR